MNNPDGRSVPIARPHKRRMWQPASIVDVHAEERNVFAFGVFFVGSIALASLLVVLDLGVARRSSVGLVLSGALVVLYFAFGQQAVRHHDERRGALFLTVVIPAAFGLFLIHSAYMSCLFGLFPLCFVMVSRRRNQILAAAGLAIAILMVNAVWEDWSAAGWLAGSLLGAMSLFFALLMGFWIEKIIAESKGRQSLIDELTTTREELAQSQHVAGVRDERQRMSAEIHDTLAQGLGSILMLVRGAQSLIGVDDDRARSLLASAEATTQDNLHDARALVEDLAPLPLQEHTLIEAIERIAARSQIESGVVTNVAIHGSPIRIQPAHEVVLLRAVQESLTNVAKHAGATTVSVSLHYDADPIFATITDNGRGFDSSDPSGFGHGLTGIATRVAGIGGTFSVRSTPDGGGTEVRVCLP